jgi:hypothetical protein
MRIYVAGPYTAPTPAAVEAHVACAIDAGLALARAGHEPFIPHLAHYLELRAQATGEGLPYAWYLAYGRFWLQHREGLLWLAPSPGANQERLIARALGLPVWLALDQVPAAHPEPRSRPRDSPR